MSIVTKQGDRGRTRLVSGEEVGKDDERLEAIGDLDELVSVLGIAACHIRGEDTAASLLDIQRTLLQVSSSLGAAPGGPRPMDEAKVRDLTDKCLELERRVDMPRDFVVPGGSPASAHLDHARAVARRCERAMVGLAGGKGARDPQLLAWINRLSDYLWLLARCETARPR